MSEELAHHLCASSGGDQQDQDNGEGASSGHQNVENARDQVWRQIQDRIKERLGLQRFGLWFKQTELMHLDESEMVVGVPNVIIKQYLETKYLSTVQQTAGELLDQEPEVRFDVAPKLLRRMRKKQQSEDEERLQESDLPDPKDQPKTAPPDNDPEHSFENLVVTASNRLPYLAAREISVRTDAQFKFLLVLGEHGVGKSALLQAASHSAKRAEVCTNVRYCMAETWCNDYYHALQNRNTRAFRRRYRKCDLLILDGVHFLQGKPAAQEELLHTTKAIQSSGGRLIFSAAEHPHDLNEAKASFQNLICGAFWVELVNPPREERYEVAAKLAERLSCRASPSVLEFVAENCGESMRELQSAVCSLAAAASLQGLDSVGLSVAKQVLGRTRRKGRSRTSGPSEICEAVQNSFGVSEDELRGRSRRRNACRARQAAMYLTRELTDLSLTDIGRHFGNRTHSTVKHSVEQAEKHQEETPQFDQALQKARKALSGA